MKGLTLALGERGSWTRLARRLISIRPQVPTGEGAIHVDPSTYVLLLKAAVSRTSGSQPTAVYFLRYVVVLVSSLSHVANEQCARIS